LETLIERDVKGLYKKAIAGEIENFTGISDPYEVPENAEVTIDSSTETIEQSLAKVLSTLEELGYTPIIEEEAAYSADEEAEIEARLAALGYL
jgi:adenylylsulfate kinase-like enzyme